ncbi:hypothetical protein [Curvibacter delicatus]|jgi:hypothetical protein|uniref:hypothetical protein n=1 Tax=Curvibacter delicatus TaxID=80879 RepID=UPI000AA6CE3F|nr:hypothetical protein [Curvibacter delicatus]
MNPAPENARPCRLNRLRQWLAQWMPVMALAVLVHALALAVLIAGVAWLIHHSDGIPLANARFDYLRQLQAITGFHALDEVTGLNKNGTLTVQQGANRSRPHCDTQQRCTRLLRPWP